MTITSDTPGKERGIALTIWLGLLILFGLWSSYRWLDIYIDWADHGRAPSIFDQDWQYFVPIVLTAVQLIGVVALWRWKYLGFQLFVGAWVLGLVYLILAGLQATTALAGGIGVVILYYLVNRKREYFD